MNNEVNGHTLERLSSYAVVKLNVKLAPDEVIYLEESYLARDIDGFNWGLMPATRSEAS